MLAPFTDLLAEHDRRRSALGAFTCYDLEVARAVLDAAAGRDRGVVLLISREAFAAPGGELLLAGVRAAAELSPARACIQLDHVADLGLIDAAFELGAGAVMADGSKLPFDENVALVQESQRLAAERGGAVEGELGHVAGGEDVAAATEAGGLTDPEQAARFVEQTEVALLAVSIGNVHGTYASEPQLDWDLLARLAGGLDLPLSLHGASGLPDADLRRAVGLGVRKINANTELRDAYLSATGEALPAAVEGLRVMDLHAAQTAAVRHLVDDKIGVLTEGSG
jgi:ketose-bisphosphate aldolase